MTIERFRNTKFRPESKARIREMRSIVAEYEAQGLRLTARQLYYQFVARDLIRNVPAEYKKLTALLTNARYAGLIDWDSIEDRGRMPDRPTEFDGLHQLTNAAVRSYRLPRWKDQPQYVELWVEKQALAGVLAPLAREFHVTLMVNKGYSSASAMYESANRIMEATGWKSSYNEVLAWHRDNVDSMSEVEQDRALDGRLEKMYSSLKPATVFYLGDHDPSGEDMVRDIRTRLVEFHRQLAKIEVKKIALTTDQIEEYDPPPNPAKITDPRARAYIAKHGDQSWEVDALPPDVLARLIREAFEAVIDREKLDEVLAREERDKKALLRAVASLK